LVLLRSRIQGNGLNGLAAHFVGGQITFYESEIAGNEGDGVQVSSVSARLMQFAAFGSRFRDNGVAGIRAENADLTLRDLVIQGNGRSGAGSGISMVRGTLSLSGSLIEGSVFGIYAIARSFISGVRITKNRAAGIIASDVLYLTDSLIAENGQNAGFTVYAGRGPGIDVRDRETRAFLINNEVRDNAGFGIMAEFPQNIEQCVNNQVTGNGLGSYNPAAAEKCK
jgi:hypothetical protein